jgi:hypothetical protein
LRNKITLWGYLIITFIICLNYYRAETKQIGLLQLYILGTHLFIYIFEYKSLRNMNVYLVWIFFSLIHLYIYWNVKDDVLLNYGNNHLSGAFRNTIFLLLFFQLLRYLSLKLQRKELVCPSRYSSYDAEDNRRVTFLDHIFLFIYIAFWLFINIKF